MLSKIMWGVGAAGFVIMTIGLFFVFLASPEREVATHIGSIVFDEKALAAGKVMFYSGAVGITFFALPWWR